MGADAEVYVFDTEVYTEQVVPFFRRLVLLGSVDDALDDRMPRIRPFAGPLKAFLEDDEARLRPTDLDAFCTYLGQDFRLRPEHRGLPLRVADEGAGWSDRACRRPDCPASPTCPFHILDGGRQAASLSSAFGAVVKATCLGESQFVGRSFNIFCYKDVLASSGVPPDGELWSLLLSLGTRGFVVGYEFSNSDGVHGWLVPEETERLMSLLQGLRLPALEPTFAAMEATRRRPGGYDLPGWTFEELSLCFVKIVATVAVERRKGILWGNDVSNWLD